MHISRPWSYGIPLRISIRDKNLLGSKQTSTSFDEQVENGILQDERVCRYAGYAVWAVSHMLGTPWTHDLVLVSRVCLS